MGLNVHSQLSELDHRYTMACLRIKHSSERDRRMFEKDAQAMLDVSFALDVDGEVCTFLEFVSKFTAYYEELEREKDKGVQEIDNPHEDVITKTSHKAEGEQKTYAQKVIESMYYRDENGILVSNINGHKVPMENKDGDMLKPIFHHIKIKRTDNPLQRMAAIFGSLGAIGGKKVGKNASTSSKD